MSSPIPISYPFPTDASPSSPGLYVPVHRRSPGSSSSSSPSSSSRALSPSLPPTLPRAGMYTPAELLSLSRSPLVAELSASHVVLDALRAAAPEVVQTRKQRKALAWRARRPSPTSPTHRRTSSRGSHSHSSESEEDRAISWRRM